MYLSIGNTPNGPIEVTTVNTTRDDWNHSIAFGYENRVYLSNEETNALFLSLATSLFDNGTITMDVADRVAYLMSAVLADREMPMPPHIAHNDFWAIDAN